MIQSKLIHNKSRQNELKCFVMEPRKNVKMSSIVCICRYCHNDCPQPVDTSFCVEPNEDNYYGCRGNSEQEDIFTFLRCSHKNFNQSFLFFRAAAINPLNKGCGLFGLDLNSGCACVAKNHG